MNLTKEQIELIETTICSVDAKRNYLEMLNDCYEPVKICGYEYAQGDALLAIDPVAFRCGLADYISAQLDDEIWVEIQGDFYWKSDVEDHIEYYT